MKKIYTAMNEAVFYYCIGNNMRLAKTFISQVLKKEVYDIKIKNAKLLKDYMYTKEKTLDYLVLTDVGYVNVEINNYYKDWRIKRDISYACKVLSNSVDKSKNYDKTKKVIQININRLGDTSYGYQTYKLNADDKKEGFLDTLTDILEIYIVNIDFYKNMVYNGNKKFIRDNYLLCAMDLKPDDIDKISEGNEELMEFKESLEKINDDEDFVKWMSAEEEAEVIKNTIISVAKKEGIEQEKLEIAKNLLNNNVSIDIISKSTGLSEKEINNLK